jgi:hypothetical protein
VEGGSCNDYDYVCGDPINRFDLSGLRGTRALPDRDDECLGGTYTQITSDPCRAYQLAKATGDSDFYYNSKTFTEPGKPNAFLTSAGRAIQSGARIIDRSYVVGRKIVTCSYYVIGAIDGSATVVVGTAVAVGGSPSGAAVPVGLGGVALGA